MYMYMYKMLWLTDQNTHSTELRKHTIQNKFNYIYILFISKCELSSEMQLRRQQTHLSYRLYDLQNDVIIFLKLAVWEFL